MNCQNCGLNLKEGVKFCKKCGTRCQVPSRFNTSHASSKRTRINSAASYKRSSFAKYFMLGTAGLMLVLVGFFASTLLAGNPSTPSPQVSHRTEPTQQREVGSSDEHSGSAYNWSQEEEDGEEEEYQSTLHNASEYGYSFLGEWFSYPFRMWVVSYTFFPDGSGKFVAEVYLDRMWYQLAPQYVAYAEDYSRNFSWSKSGNVISLTSNEQPARWRGWFASEFTILECNNYLYHNAYFRLRRERPVNLVPGVVVPARELVADGQLAIGLQDAVSRRLLGDWHIDAFIFSFFEDGTVEIDLPGRATRTFTYELFFVGEGIGGVDNVQLWLTSDIEGAGFNIFRPNFDMEARGDTVTLSFINSGPAPLRLTRFHDMNNYPFSDQIIGDAVQLLNFFVDTIKKFK